MSSSLSSNMNTSINTNKNPLINESSENFYKVFKKLRNSAPAENENLIIELLNLDFQVEENYRFSLYYIIENFNKVLEYYNNLNNPVFRNTLDKFISNANFKYLFENEFLRTLLEKESSRFFDTKNLKVLNLNSTVKNHLEPSSIDIQEQLVTTKDGKYFVQQVRNVDNNWHHGDQTTRNDLSRIDKNQNAKDNETNITDIKIVDEIIKIGSDQKRNSNNDLENSYHKRHQSETHSNYTINKNESNQYQLKNNPQEELRRSVIQKNKSPFLEPENQKIKENIFKDNKILINNDNKNNNNNNQNFKSHSILQEKAKKEEVKLTDLSNLPIEILDMKDKNIKSNESKIIENIVINNLKNQNKNFESQKFLNLQKELMPLQNKNAEIQPNKNTNNNNHTKNKINFNRKLNNLLINSNTNTSNNNLSNNNLINASINKFNNLSLNKSILKNHSILKTNLNESTSIHMKSKIIDLNYSYFKNSSAAENLKSKSRQNFYNLFIIENKYAKSYLKFDSVKDYYKELARHPRNKLNEIYQKLLSKNNYLDMDQELRLLYLNYFVLINPFLTPSQMENLEKEIIDVYLLNNKQLGDFSSESQRIFREAFLNTPKKKSNLNANNNNNANNNDNCFGNPNINNNDLINVIERNNAAIINNENPANNTGPLLHENIISDYLEKKDSFNDTNIFSVFENVRKIKNIKNLYKILIYDDMLKYLKPEIKIKIKFFFYILIQYFEKLANNKTLLLCLYIFKFFFYDTDNTPNPDNESEQNFCLDLAKIPFNKTGIKEMDYNIKNLFKKKFFKNGKSLEINGINFDNIFINFKIEDVFAKGEISIFEEVISKIKFFYNKNLERKKAKLALLAPHNVNFVFNILDFVDFKAKQKVDYKKIFFNLEKEIFKVYEHLMSNDLSISSNKDFNIFSICKNNNNIDFNGSKKISKDFSCAESALYFYPFIVYKSQKEAFDQLVFFIERFTENFNNNRKTNGFKGLIKSKLLPFGSITQLIGGPNADLDLYLDLQMDCGIYDNNNNTNFNDAFSNNKFNYKANENNINDYANSNYKNYYNNNNNKFTNRKNYNDCDDTKAKYIIDLYSELKNSFLKRQKSSKLKGIVTKRLITITFDFQPGSGSSNVNVDINFHNSLGVLNSSLLRTYSLIDQRFSILTIYLKHIVKEYGIKRDESKQDRFNSYSWTFILLTFLQDVIQPPVLPKVLSHFKNKNEVFKVKAKIKSEASEAKDAKKLKKAYNPNKNFFRLENIKEFFMQNKDEIEHTIPDFLNLLDESNAEDKKFLEDFYKNNRNEMSVAEIFFAFLEFVTFYFKFETNFVYAAGNDKEEGFYGKHILKAQDFNDIGTYFRNKTVLMRDPLDIWYNPLGNVEEKSLKSISDGLRKCYQDIILKKS